MSARILSVGLAVLAGGCEWGPIVDIGDRLVDAGVAPTADAGFDASDDAGVRDAAANVGDDLADLTIVALFSPPATIVPGETLDVRVEVLNHGARVAPETVVLIRVVREDGPPGPRTSEIGRVAIPSLAPGDRVERARILPTPPQLTSAHYHVVAEVDPDGRIEELDEDDNRLQTASFTVSFVTLVPAPVDFGTVGVGCRAALTARVENRGRTRVVVSPLSLTQPAPFELDAPTEALPIDPEEAIEVQLAYAPTTVGEDEVALLFTHGQIAGATPIPVRGRGAIEPMREEKFLQQTTPAIDILFVVDDSPSMAEERDALALAAGAFLAELDARGVAYHVAVTTTDTSPSGAGGAFVGAPAIITPTTANRVRVLETSLTEGTAVALANRGLEASRAALDAPLRDGANAGFLREEAALAIVYVSDEDDRSPGEVDDFVDFFRALEGPNGDTRFIAAAIVGPAGGCPTATPGDRYASVAQQTAGTVSSICTLDGDDLMGVFGPGFGYRQRFELSRTPMPSTIAVEVDGVPLSPTSWRYDAAAPAIVFDAVAVPEPGVSVVVRYRTPC